MPRYPATIQVRVSAAQQYALEQIAGQLGVPYADVVRWYLPSEPLEPADVTQLREEIAAARADEAEADDFAADQVGEEPRRSRRGARRR